MIENYESTDVFLGIDVGKSFQNAVGLSRVEKVFLEQRPTNDEADITNVITNNRPMGKVLLVVDQPSDIGASPFTVAWESGVGVTADSCAC